MIKTADKLVEYALQEFESSLIGYAASILHDHDKARDVVQDTFVRLYKQDVEKVQTGLKSWLYTVCRNRALDVLRKEKRIVGMDDEFMAFQKSSVSEPSTTVDNQERVEEVMHHMASLTENQQKVIRLKFEQGMSYQEISAQTGLTASNVGFLLHNGLKKLRQQLSKNLLTGVGN